MLVLGAIVLFVFPIIALVSAANARAAARELAVRLDALEAEIARLTTHGAVRTEPAAPVTPSPQPETRLAAAAPSQTDVIRSAAIDAPPDAVEPQEPQISLTASPPPLVPAAPAEIESPAAIAAPPAPPPLPPLPPRPEPNQSEPPAPPPPPAPATSPGFEERIGTRWVVWLGVATLALGGIFMVRYSIEAGLLGPGVRLILSGLFALALLGVGEWLRRTETAPVTATFWTANIPALLTAAGTLIAYATVYAAYALYGFLSPAIAFTALGAVALGTLALALLHGPGLAGLGVVGAFVTPVLVQSNRPDFWALYIYLAIVTAAGFGLARVRLWRWLAITTMAFAVWWTLPAIGDRAWIAPHLFHVTAGFTLAALLVVCSFAFGPPAERGRVEPISSWSLAVYLAAAALVVVANGHEAVTLVTFSALVVGTLFVAWRAEAAAGAVAAAAGLVFVVFAEWAVRANPDFVVLPGLDIFTASASDESTGLHLTAAIALAAIFGVAGVLAQGRSTHARIPAVWAASGVFAPLALLVTSYARVAHFDRSIPLAATALLLAVLFGVATEWLTRRPQKVGGMIATAIYATGTLAALALAFTFAMERGWLTIALALMSAGTAWVSLQRPIPFLRWLSGALAAIVTVRVAFEPRIAGDVVGATPIFNWLLYGYGLPALSFWTAGRLLRKRADDAPGRAVDSAAILFTVLLAFMEIRHAVNGGDVYRSGPRLMEVALHVCTLLSMAAGLEWQQRKSGSVVHKAGAVIVGMLALAGIGGGLLLLENPMLTSDAVGAPIINTLLLAYALPGVLASALAWMLLRRSDSPDDNSIIKPYTLAVGAAGLALIVVYAMLEIRRLFHGPVLTIGPTDLPEVAIQVCVLFALAMGLERLQAVTANIVHKTGALVVGSLALAGVAFGLLLSKNPILTGEPVGGSIVNYLLLGYALPAVLATLLAWMLHFRDDIYARVVRATGIALLLIFVELQIKWFFHGSVLTAGRTTLAEAGVQIIALLLFALGLEYLQRRTNNIVHWASVFVVGGLSLAAIVLALFGANLPILTGDPIDGVFINSLLLGYMLPAILAVVLGRTIEARLPGDTNPEQIFAHAIAATGLALMLAYISLEIRRIYQGPVLAFGAISDAEQYTYSVAWLLSGVILLAAGFWKNSQRARLASAVVIGLTMVKVIFVDTAALTGIYRALSLMGSGLVLVAIGWFYQRVVFRPAAANSPEPPAQNESPA